MSANTFGNILKMTSFGESHGKALGVIVDGCPAGLNFDFELVARNMERRRPGTSKLVSGRNERDQFELLSGVFENKTIGSPIAMVVYNHDAKSEDYEKIKHEARVGHADDLWQNKFGHRDYRGGGRASGRETLSRVLAGSLAQMLLKRLSPQTGVYAFSETIYTHSIASELADVLDFLKNQDALKAQDWIDSFPARFPSKQQSAEVEELLHAAKAEGKSYGGDLLIYVKSPPPNLGQPVFHKLKADLATALLSIGATCSLTIGTGEPSLTEGSRFHTTNQSPHYGGIRGGISTGDDIILKLGFKPTSSVLETAKKGRHDPCIIPRAAVVAEAMVNFVLADHLLWGRLDKISL